MLNNLFRKRKRGDKYLGGDFGAARDYKIYVDASMGEKCGIGCVVFYRDRFLFEWSFTCESKNITEAEAIALYSAAKRAKAKKWSAYIVTDDQNLVRHSNDVVRYLPAHPLYDITNKIRNTIEKSQGGIRVVFASGGESHGHARAHYIANHVRRDDSAGKAPTKYPEWINLRKGHIKGYIKAAIKKQAETR